MGVGEGRPDCLSQIEIRHPIKTHATASSELKYRSARLAAASTRLGVGDSSHFSLTSGLGALRIDGELGTGSLNAVYFAARVQRLKIKLHV